MFVCCFKSRKMLGSRKIMKKNINQEKYGWSELRILTKDDVEHMLTIECITGSLGQRILLKPISRSKSEG